MLRTPTSAPWNQGGCGGEPEAEIKALLPTPSATEYGSNQSPSDGAAVRPSLDRLVRLLPTPRANIAKQGLPREGNWGELRAEVMSLLPMPGTMSGGQTKGSVVKQRGCTAYRADGTKVQISTQQALIGVSSDQQSDDGSRFTDLRLSPSFVEWMIGAPDGWSDPDCPLSAMEFRCSSEGSPGNI